MERKYIYFLGVILVIILIIFIILFTFGNFFGYGFGNGLPNEDCWKYSESLTEEWFERTHPGESMDNWVGYEWRVYVERDDCSCSECPKRLLRYGRIVTEDSKWEKEGEGYLEDGEMFWIS